jgi:hypothetical protein
VYPHGLICIGATAMFAVDDSGTWHCDQTATAAVRIAPALLVHRLLFAIPGIRDVVMWTFGCRDVARVSMNAHLNAGRSFAFLPDGARGILPRDGDSGEVLSQRRQWFDLLWDSPHRDSIVIVPCFSQHEPEAVNVLRRMRDFSYRTLGYPFPSFFNLRRLPQLHGPPVTMKLGRPVRLRDFGIDHIEPPKEVAWRAFATALSDIGGPRLKTAPPVLPLPPPPPQPPAERAQTGRESVRDWMYRHNAARFKANHAN